MDIWAWVGKLHDDLMASGNERMADLLYTIPDYINDCKVEQAQALIPEVLAFARSSNNPWLEVFIRHWQMRLRLGPLAEGETALAEAVALLEFSHREGHRECPQSVCTVQDIASCYGETDGPGWVEERKAVCLETLARIDASWNCFTCLSGEYAAALCDGGAFLEALEFLDQQTHALERLGKSVYPLNSERIRALKQLGRYPEALAVLDAQQVPEEQRNAINDEADRLDRVALLALLGRYEEAASLLPAWGEVSPRHFEKFLDAAFHLASGNTAYNDWRLGARFRHALAYAVRVGKHRSVFTLGRQHVLLSLERGSVWAAERALESMEAHLPLLRVSLGADVMVRELRAKAAALPAGALPVAEAEPSALLAHIAGQDIRDPEQEAGWLFALLAEHPVDVDVVEALLDALHACGAATEAAALLWNLVAEHPEHAEGFVPRLIALIPEHDHDALPRLRALVAHHSPHLALWCAAHQAMRNKQWGEMARHLEAFVGQMPEAAGAYRLWAYAATEAGDFAQALALYQTVVRLREDRGDAADAERWHILTLGSICGAWRVVREHCVALGMEVPVSDDPIDDEDGQWVCIRYREDGGDVDYVAIRTGPATAQIIEVSVPGGPQRVGDRVAFDATPLADPPEDEEEAQGFVMPYRHVHTLQAGGRRGFTVDGADPSAEEWEPFLTALGAEDVRVWIHSSREYRVQNPQEPQGEGLPGLYFSVAPPRAMPLAVLHALLAKATAAWQHPMCWLALAQAAGADPAPHEAIKDKYGL